MKQNKNNNTSLNMTVIIIMHSGKNADFEARQN